MDDQEMILEIHRQWLERELSGHPLEVLDLCSEDILWIIPGAKNVSGKENVRKWLRIQPAVVIEAIDIDQMIIELSSQVAIKTANFTTTIRDQNASLQVKGSHLWTLRKDVEKAIWQVTRVSWSIIKDDLL